MKELDQKILQKQSTTSPTAGKLVAVMGIKIPVDKLKAIDLGKMSEDYVAGYLEGNGYNIVTRNYRTLFGEIDIIAEWGDMLVFVEVRSRGSMKYGEPAETVDTTKLSKIIKSIHVYNMKNETADRSMRVDVVDCRVIVNVKQKFIQMKHYEDVTW